MPDSRFDDLINTFNLTTGFLQDEVEGWLNFSLDVALAEFRKSGWCFLHYRYLVDG